MRSALLLLLTLLICHVTPELAIGQERYEFLLLGGFGKDLDSTPNAINELGQVTGVAMTASFESHAFRTKPNAPIDRKTDDLGSDGFISTGLDINDLGQVVGHTWQPGSEPRVSFAFRTAPNSPINQDTDDLGNLGGPAVIAYSINNAGQVAGWSGVSGSNETHSYRTGPNLPINPATDDLGVGTAYGMNESGQVVGELPNGHLFRTSSTAGIEGSEDLMSGGQLSGSRVINSLGQIAAFSYAATPRAFVTQPGEPISLPDDYLDPLGATRTVVFAVNDLGMAVGGRERTAGRQDYRATLFENGRMLDLNSLADTNGWTLFAARDINNRGQIVGDAHRGLVSQTFLLTPVPEPASIVLAIVGFIGAAAMARRRSGRQVTLRAAD